MGNDTARFEDDWLALREPADHAARSLALAEALARWFGEREELRVLDLGAGAGSNLRWLAPRLPGYQSWTLLDHDAGLLERAERASGFPGGKGRAQIRTRCADLADISDCELQGFDLVTASALFDLVSGAWTERLVRALAASGACGLFALTVDGRRWFENTDGQLIDDEMDRRMGDLFNHHQRREKGLGESLGPQAAAVLPAALQAAGMRVRVERSDWRLAAGDPATPELAAALLEDWARAAVEQGSGEEDVVEDWRVRRHAGLVNGELGLGVGHVDILALPSRRHD